MKTTLYQETCSYNHCLSTADSNNVDVLRRDVSTIVFLRTAVSCGRWSCWDSKHFGCWCVKAQDSFDLNMFHYNYRGAVSSLLSHQHWTPNSKTNLEVVSVVQMYDNGDSIESHAAAAQQDL